MSWNYWLSLLAGYAFSVMLGTLFVRTIVSELHRHFTREGPDFLAQVVGWVERTLYTTSWLLGVPEFIAVWLALKVAGQWKRWAEDVAGVPGRAYYNIFLIGSGMSIAYGITGAKLVQWLRAENWAAAVGYPIGLIVGSVVLWLLIARFGKSGDGLQSI